MLIFTRVLILSTVLVDAGPTGFIKRKIDGHEMEKRQYTTWLPASEQEVPLVEEPVAEEPVVILETEVPAETEVVVYEEPVAEAPAETEVVVYETPAAEEPVVILETDVPVESEAPAETEVVVYETPAAEEPVAEEPVVILETEVPVESEVPCETEEVVYETPVAEEPVAEEPVAEVPVVILEEPTEIPIYETEIPCETEVPVYEPVVILEEPTEVPCETEVPVYETVVILEEPTEVPCETEVPVYETEVPVVILEEPTEVPCETEVPVYETEVPVVILETEVPVETEVPCETEVPVYETEVPVVILETEVPVETEVPCETEVPVYEPVVILETEVPCETEVPVVILEEPVEVACETITITATVTDTATITITIAPTPVYTPPKTMNAKEVPYSGIDKVCYQTPTFCSANNLGDILADGSQSNTSTCSETTMGVLPDLTNLVSTLIREPLNGDIIILGQDISIKIESTNINYGFFSDPASEYYTEPQETGINGNVNGHNHITVERISEDSAFPDPLNPIFFVGLNESVDADNLLSTVVAGNTITESGTYRICTITSSNTHQPVLMPVARRGTSDDCIRITVV